MSAEVRSLGEAYPEEQARCRELIERYQELAKLPGVNVSFAVAGIKDVLRRADRAAIEQDTVAMLRIYQEMKEIES